jgi:serine/threonine protein kinase/TolB-like protein
MSDPLAFGHFRVATNPDGTPVELGRGAMGVTYKAFDARLRIDVALKIISPAQVDNPRAQSLFLREARAAARVRHSNVASVLELDDTPGQFFYAMEFIDGESLREWMPARVPLKPELAISIATQIARGLKAIHAQDIVHRDLKPANIMLVRARSSSIDPAREADSWEVKIIDFGVARATGPGRPDDVTATQTAGFRGTALYASPEQCEERGEIDGRSDLYSLGCILWEMLVGSPPFRARTQREILNQHVAQNAPLDRIAHFPPSLQAVIARLLAKDPDQRFVDADAVITALEHCRAQLTTGGDSSSASALTNKDIEAAASPPSTFLPANTLAIPAGAVNPSKSERTQPIGFLLAVTALALVVAGWLVWRGRSSADSPARVASTTPGAAATPTVAQAAPPAATPRKAVAVLPFANLSPDKDNEYFADGIHEEVLTNLSRIRDLKVISRTSVLRFKGDQRDLREIARMLGVGSVVEGSVRKAGNRVRVSAQLIDAATDQHLWADNFDGDLDDVFVIQSQIAGKIAKALAANISPDETTRIDRKPTENLEAYDYFLRGRAANQRQAFTGPDANLESIDFLKKAIAADPGFAAAYAVLSIVEGEIFYFGYDQSDAQAKRVRDYADRALQLQPDLSEAHLAAGFCRYRLESDYAAALREFQMASQLLPNGAEPFDAAALALRRLGRWDESVEASRRAIELSPLELQNIANLAWTYRYLRRFEEAEQLTRRLTELSGYPLPKQHGALYAFERTGDFPSYYALMNGLEFDLDPLITLSITYRLVARDYDGLSKSLEPHRNQILRDAVGACPVTLVLGWTDILAGNKARAETDLRDAIERLKSRTKSPLSEATALVLSAQAYALLAMPDDSRRAAERAMAILPDARDAYAGPQVMEEAALAFAWTGDRDRAVDLLEHLLQIPSLTSKTLLRFDPRWDPLRGDPRFEKLIAVDR